MKIVFVNRFFFPDISATSQMLSDLAFQLATDNVVHIVTSRLRYDDPDITLPKYEVASGVTIHRVWTSCFGRESTLGRLCDYLTFYVTAPFKVFLLAARDDVVVVKTDPPMISVPIMVAACLRGARLVNWLQDLFPEVAISLGMKLGGRLVRGTLRWIRNLSLRAADANVVLGSRMEAVVVHHAPHVPVHVVPNWSPTVDIVPLTRTINPLSAQWHMGGRFIVGYSGNLGRAHELGIILDAAELLRHRLEIIFLIIGDGNQKENLQSDVISRGLHNVIFKPYQPIEQLKYSLTLPDVHLVSLKPALEGLIVPSKFYSSIAAGRAVIFIGDQYGEIAQKVIQGACGVTVTPDNAIELARAIELLCNDVSACARMGSNARTMFEAKYSQAIAIGRWRVVLRKYSPNKIVGH